MFRKFLRNLLFIGLVTCRADTVGAFWHGSTAVIGKALINDGSSPSSFIFANMMKTASSLFPQISPTYPYPAYLDDNGYPNNAPGNVLGDNLLFTFGAPVAWGSQTLVVSWTGTGAFIMTRPGGAALNIANLTCSTSCTNTSTSTAITVTGTNVRFTFNFVTAPLGDGQYNGFFGNGVTYNGMSKLIFCRATDEAAVNTNQNALNPDYVSMLKMMNPRTFRGLDISGTNGANLSHFSQRWGSGAFSFLAQRFQSTLWAGSVSGDGSSGNPYIASAPAGWTGLSDSAAIQVQFTTANAGFQPVINVAGVGNIRITDIAPNDLSGGQITAGAIGTLTYSSVYNYWTLTTISIGPNGDAGFTAKVPLEQHIDIANACNCNLWYPMSHRYTMADATAIAGVVLGRLNSSLAFYPEVSNEVWNTQFTQSSFIDNLGLTMGFPHPSNYGQSMMSAYGLLVRRQMGAITTAFGGPSGRLRRVMAFQAYGDAGVLGANNLYRFKGTDLAPSGTSTGTGNSIYNSFTGSANYTTSPNRPIDFADVMAYATYSAGGQLLQFDANYQTPNTSGQPTINAISKANPGVITFATDPGYPTGVRAQVNSASGMTQINGVNTTMTRVDATHYSMFTDATMSTGIDTTGFSTYTGTSGRTALYPIVSGLTAWADLFATGTGPNITSALNSVDTDLRSGSQYNGSQVLSQNGTQTLLDLNNNIYPAWESIAASYDGARPSGAVNLTIEAYEGAVAPFPLSATSCITLGINTSYATSVQNLLFAYKNDARFSTLVQNQYAQYVASNPLRYHTPAQYQIVGTGGPWALTPTDLYSLPPLGSGEYQSFDGIRAFNH